MTLFPNLGELGSATVQLVLIAGVALILPSVIDRRRTLHRTLLFVVAFALALRYAWWRGTETLAPRD